MMRSFERDEGNPVTDCYHHLPLYNVTKMTKEVVLCIVVILDQPIIITLFAFSHPHLTAVYIS